MRYGKSSLVVGCLIVAGAIFYYLSPDKFDSSLGGPADADSMDVQLSQSKRLSTNSADLSHENSRLASNDILVQDADIKHNQRDTAVFAPNGEIADEVTTRLIVRQEATEDVQRNYGSLLGDLDLTPEELEELFNLLVDDYVAVTKTPYKRAETIDENEQSAKIASIIGDDKLDKFRELEENIGAYGEVQKIASLLEMNGVPLTDAQQGKLLGIVNGTLENFTAGSTDGAIIGSVELVENHVALVAEHERHIMELVSSVLTPEQVLYLHEQYQFLAFMRENAVERHRQALADGTSAPEGPQSFPQWIGN